MIRKIHIGTSGWSYDGWIGAFYPPDTAPDELLGEYKEYFSSVEINTSFYHTPHPKAVEHWREKVPEKFVFSWKANRYITHMKKLTDPQQSLERLFAATEPLKEKLGPILFQLPPRWKKNIDRLAAFLEVLPKDHRYSFEFRDKSWLCKEVYDLLDKYEAALCFYDLKTYKSPEIPTGDFIYIRLHGPDRNAYEGSYEDKALSAYAGKFIDWAAEGKEVFCYFDNDKKAHAPFNAQTLLKAVSDRLRDQTNEDGTKNDT